MFGLPRYAEVIEAYLAGLEELAARDPQVNLSSVPSVASFFVSRVDTAVDRRLAEIGTPDAGELRGQAALAQAKLAYQMFLKAFTGPRWNALAARGARVQRPLWASTSAKDPAAPDTRYVDELIGPDTITTMPPATIAAVTDHGTLARTVDRNLPGAQDALTRLLRLGIDLDEVSAALEAKGVSSFIQSFRAPARCPGCQGGGPRRAERGRCLTAATSREAHVEGHDGDLDEPHLLQVPGRAGPACSGGGRGRAAPLPGARRAGAERRPQPAVRTRQEGETA